MHHKKILSEKFSEAITSVIPITLIVLLLCFTITPIPNNMLVSFIFGAVMLVIGMAFFTLGADTAMTPIGNKVGATITKSRNVWIVVFISFLLRVIITISEPDLQVLANQVPNIPNMVIILSVALGVGIFLIIAMLRILIGISLSWLLLGFYALVFILATQVPGSFWAVAFDSGGVASGPMTATFLLPFAMGACESIGGLDRIVTDAFGVVAMTPLITIQILVVIYKFRTHREEAAKAKIQSTISGYSGYGDYDIIEL